MRPGLCASIAATCFSKAASGVTDLNFSSPLTYTMASLKEPPQRSDLTVRVLPSVVSIVKPTREKSVYAPRVSHTEKSLSAVTLLIVSSFTP